MRFLRIGICALLAFAVLAHGGVEDWARAVFEAGAALLLVAWAVRLYFYSEEPLRIPALLLPLIAFGILAALQWLFRSASPFATRAELLLFSADVILILLAAQAFRTIQDWRRLAWFVIVFGFLVSGFGILQHLTFNGKLYWFREMTYGGIPFGPYVNRNHFAGFAELVIPLSLVPLILGKVRRERLASVAIFAVIPLAALFLAASRGGLVSVFCEVTLLLLLLVVRHSLGKHALVGAAVLVLAFSLVSWIGVRQILSRFSSFQTLEVPEGKRASMRHGAWRMFLDYPVAGVGLGAFEAAYPPYETQYDGKIVNHAHNDYLEVLAETGVVGGLCCAWFLAVLFIASVKRIQNPSSPFAGVLHLAGLTGCCGILVHSLVDFNLHIPANAFLFLLMALLATVPISAPEKLPAPDDRSVTVSKFHIHSARVPV